MKQLNFVPDNSDICSPTLSCGDYSIVFYEFLDFPGKPRVEKPHWHDNYYPHYRAYYCGYYVDKKKIEYSSLKEAIIACERHYDQL